MTLINETEAAARLGVHPKTLSRWRRIDKRADVLAALRPHASLRWVRYDADTLDNIGRQDTQP